MSDVGVAYIFENVGVSDFKRNLGVLPISARSSDRAQYLFMNVAPEQAPMTTTSEGHIYIYENVT